MRIRLCDFRDWPYTAKTLKYPHLDFEHQIFGPARFYPASGKS